MTTQFLLDEDDIKQLTKLMLLMIETQESRKQLCRDLGINPQEVSFIKDSSDDTFCTELIDCLNRFGYQENLCKLCCQKLFPILNKSVYSHRISILKNIIEKLNCNCNFTQDQHNHPIPTVTNLHESKPESWFAKIGNVNKKLLASGVIMLIGLAGFSIGQSHKTAIAGCPASYPWKLDWGLSSKSFAGEWNQNGTHIKIDGDKVTVFLSDASRRPNGEGEVISENPPKIQVNFPDHRTLRGELVQSNCLKWNDGTFWSR
ncbi:MULTISPECIES: hypothetical protein [Fischerella]|uniref:Uncharacterized protein n=2 Tax=Fischerella TaxID=1190 RepID=A0A2N6K818_FISMU|nr:MULTISPECIES: hypothetical protein [Fischerella]MBD2433098.1 hypothetical protein [Fischerella sp. FACHB-380]PLZ93643.1 hypothetical protein CEN44_02725 [Fischerella muscicola CCMEE 5323]